MPVICAIPNINLLMWPMRIQTLKLTITSVTMYELSDIPGDLWMDLELIFSLFSLSLFTSENVITANIYFI